LTDKTRERPSWDEYFLGVAITTASMSSCFNINTGAVLVKNKRIISTGYNGAFAGYNSCYKEGQCRKEKLGFANENKNIGICPASHAEVNALAEVSRKEAQDASLYCVVFPCSYCAKAIAHSGISKVYYMTSYEEPDNQTMHFFNSRETPVELIKIDTPYLQKLHKSLLE
jgi:dCMP deaminase